MSQRRVLFVNWQVMDGAAQGKKKLHIKNNYRATFTCSVKLCLHADLRSNRGLRKHIENKHPRFYYFEEQLEIKRKEIELIQPAIKRASTLNIPSFSIDEGRGNDFLTWLGTTCGGGKSCREGKQIAKRAMKFLMECTEENQDHPPLCNELIDCCLGSPQIIIRFLTTLEKEWKLSYSSSLSYVKSISDLLDFRKSEGVTDCNLRCFTVTEVYLRRAKENLRKKKNLECTRNFDLESLIACDSWASLDDMQKVVPFHTARFETYVKKCIQQSPLPTKNELMFCTRFISTVLFLKVKCSRPMTFQYLTIEMIEKAKTNGGFIDQTQFKTSSKYLFDTLIITEETMVLLDEYIVHVRPLLHPQTNYLLTSSTGSQYQSLTTAMTLLVHQAIGKHINPTRYRQIVETTSSDILSRDEQECISQDQKHSSTVAKVYYKKKLSRQVALEGKRCMEKMIGATSTKSSAELNLDLNETSSLDDDQLTKSTTNPFQSVNLMPQNITTISDNGLMEKVQNILTIPLSTFGSENMEKNDDEIAITKTINSTPFPVCSYDQSSISKNVKIKKERASIEARKSSLKHVKFTPEEDNYLKKGIEKYGRKSWTNILKSNEYIFHECRTRDSLRMRSESAAFKRSLNLHM